MKESPFENKSVPKAYFSLSLPVVLGMVVTIFYNITDTYFIAKTGNTSLVAGISLCAPVFTMLMAFGNIFGQGGSSLISRLLVEEATDINFYVGKAINPAHQNPNLPINFSIKMQIVEELSACLRQMGKRIKVSYF